VVQQVQVIAKLSLQDPLPQRSRRILSINIYVYIVYGGKIWSAHALAVILSAPHDQSSFITVFSVIAQKFPNVIPGSKVKFVFYRSVNGLYT